MTYSQFEELLPEYIPDIVYSKYHAENIMLLKYLWIVRMHKVK